MKKILAAALALCLCLSLFLPFSFAEEAAADESQHDLFLAGVFFDANFKMCKKALMWEHSGNDKADESGLETALRIYGITNFKVWPIADVPVGITFDTNNGEVIIKSQRSNIRQVGIDPADVEATVGWICYLVYSHEKLNTEYPNGELFDRIPVYSRNAEGQYEAWTEGTGSFVLRFMEDCYAPYFTDYDHKIVSYVYPAENPMEYPLQTTINVMMRYYRHAIGYIGSIDTAAFDLPNGIFLFQDEEDNVLYVVFAENDKAHDGHYLVGFENASAEDMSPLAGFAVISALSADYSEEDILLAFETDGDQGRGLYIQDYDAIWHAVESVFVGLGF